MNLRRFRYKLYKLPYQLQIALRRRGVIGTTTIILNKLLRRSGPPKQFAALHPFDAEFGVDTSGLIPPDEICEAGRKYNPYNAGFLAVPPSVFSQNAACVWRLTSATSHSSTSVRARAARCCWLPFCIPPRLRR